MSDNPPGPVDPDVSPAGAKASPPKPPVWRRPLDDAAGAGSRKILVAVAVVASLVIAFETLCNPFNP